MLFTHSKDRPALTRPGLDSTSTEKFTVLEAEVDVHRLQSMLDHSIAHAGPFLRSSFQMPEKSLGARQLIRRLTGSLTLALATVSSSGTPRVAPVIAFFVRGRFYIPTVRDSLRARHVAGTPQVSLTHYEGNDFAVIAHGTAAIVVDGDSEFEDLRHIHQRLTGEDVRTWGDALYLRIEPTHFYTFARNPEQFPE